MSWACAIPLPISDSCTDCEHHDTCTAAVKCKRPVLCEMRLLGARRNHYAGRHYEHADWFALLQIQPSTVRELAERIGGEEEQYLLRRRIDGWCCNLYKAGILEIVDYRPQMGRSGPARIWGVIPGRQLGRVHSRSDGATAETSQQNRGAVGVVAPPLDGGTA